MSERELLKEGGVTHAIAICTKCEWESQDYLTARRKAREHARRTGHRVSVEECRVIIYAPGRGG